MKYLVLLLVIICRIPPSYAQVTPSKMPSFVYVADGKIITRSQFVTYGNNGDVASLKSSVSVQEYDSLRKILGDSIGPHREFVKLLTLFTEKEKAERAMASKSAATDSAQTPMKMKVATTENELVGQTATDFRVAMSDGQSRQLSLLKGNVVMISFWATWCAPCMMEFYHFPDAIIKPFSDKPFVLLPIARGQTKEIVLAKMAEFAKEGIRFPVGWEKDDAAIEKFGGSGRIPRTLLIDKKGIIRYVFVGAEENNPTVVAQKISELIAE